MKLTSNFRRLVLGCIDADFLQPNTKFAAFIFSISTKCTFLSNVPNLKHHKNSNNFANIAWFRIDSLLSRLRRLFCWNFEIWAVQKYVNLVDLVKSFPTSIYLKKSASIQPRTSLSKFGGKFNSFFIRLLSRKDRCVTGERAPDSWKRARRQLVAVNRRRQHVACGPVSTSAQGGEWNNELHDKY